MDNSLWDVAIEQAKLRKGDDNYNSEESTIFLVGSKNSGKTSIILRFLERDEPPKPTVALEYTFGRRARGNNLAKDVGHIWELGGGTWLSKLMEIPLTPSTLLNTTMLLVLDLSVPSELWFTMDTLLRAAKTRLDEAIKEAKAKDPSIKEKLQKRAWERVGVDHPDKSMMDPFLIPLVIVGSKYDLFKNFDSEQRKNICKTLRFVAHVRGASLQFFSIKEEQLISRMRGVFNYHLFGAAASKTIQVDHNKPIFVSPGQDTVQQIGSPPLSEKEIGRDQAKTPMDLWQVAFTGIFPQANTNDPAMVDDPAKDPQFAESSIDNLRSQKDEELESYRRLAERRAREPQLSS